MNDGFNHPLRPSLSERRNPGSRIVRSSQSDASDQLILLAMQNEVEETVPVVVMEMENIMCMIYLMKILP